MTDRQYEEFEEYKREELELAFAGTDPEQISKALYSAAKFQVEWKFTQERCLSLLKHENSAVRWAAALALGYVALYQRRLELERVLPRLYEVQDDAAIGGAVRDALEMIETYIPKN